MSLEEKEKIKIKISDYQRNNLRDEISDRPRKNRVRVYSRIPGEDKVTLESDTTNLILYRGRDWLMQRAFYKDLDSITRTTWKDKYISWFAIGVGAALPATPLVQINPTSPDIALAVHGLIGSGIRYVTVNSKQYHLFDTGYPQFLNDPDIVNADLANDCTHIDPVDSNTYRCDKYLIAQIITTLPSSECNGDGVSTGCGVYSSGPLAGKNYQDINEAGLFVSPSNSTGYSFLPDAMDIFARVTFPTMRKDERRELIFSWLVYF